MERIISGSCEAEIEVKKSRFLAVLANCRSEAEAQQLIETVRKRHYDARHNCYAWRISGENRTEERQSDDGEPQGTAGKPMLELLRGSGLSDVCAVVTRYFGGTLLGTGGLVRAYSDALREALAKAELHTLSEGVRMCVRCDYAAANRVRYLAQQRGFFPEREEFTERCALWYLVPEEACQGFADAVRELSAGAAETERTERVLYFGTETPEVYRVLEHFSGGASGTEGK